MALRKLVTSNHGRKKPVSIIYENLHSFKEGVILLCQSILETRRISHLHGSALFTIPLKRLERRKIVTLKTSSTHLEKQEIFTGIGLRFSNYKVIT